SRLAIDQVKPGQFSSALRQTDWVCGAAMVLPGDFVRETGGFDPAIFLYGEDEDLCIEARRRGLDVVVVDTVPVVHVFGWGVNRFNPRVADLKYESLSYFIRKNISSLSSRIMMLTLLPLYIYGWRRFFYAWRGGQYLRSIKRVKY
ncbi:MAG: hypothetical protein HGB11_13405, partial [Chlorobiales bacterium]|nr:hypothetical protein [Chlorobiales bacterium]